MAYARAKKVDADVIPVIDISLLRDGTDPKAVAQALHAANEGLGFIYITGHGIPDNVIEAARESAYEFFVQLDGNGDPVWSSSISRRANSVPHSGHASPTGSGRIKP